MIHCGSGGVGKTTTAAAAAAMAAVHHGGKVLVLTVDPAKRLANALGLEAFGNSETQVPPAAFAAAGVEPRGELWAAMLDTKQSWDDLVRRHAPDAATRDAILANPLYKNITGRFVQSHDYIAMERLYEIHASGTYDLIVVDTPPTRNAIDFLEAPERMADFFSSRLLRWLTVPARSRVLDLASKPFYSVADRILGSKFLEDIAEFFLLFQTMYDGFVERAKAVTRTLADKRTTFVVVSTLESAPVREAEFFIDALEDRGLHLGAVVLNKVLPTWFLDKGATGAAPGAVRRAPRSWPAGSRRASARPSRSPACCARWARASSTSRWWPSARPRCVPSSAPRPRWSPPCRTSTTTSPTSPGCSSSASRSGGERRPARWRWRRATPPRPRPPSRCWPPAATPSTRAWPAASRRPSPSPRSPASAGAASSSPARPAARRCCSTSSSTPPASVRRARRRVRSTSRRSSCAFSGADQAFHVGLGSVAVPGCLPGWLHAHRAWAAARSTSSPRPARRLAAEGVEVNEQQAYLLRILEPILTRTAEAAAIVAPGGRLLGGGDRLVNPALAAFLVASTSGGSRPRRWRRPIERRDGAPAAGCSRRPTSRRYAVVERVPLAVAWRGHRLLTNPPPAFGGELVALGLLQLEAQPGWPAAPGSPSTRSRSPRRWWPPRTARPPGTVAGALARRRATGGTTHVSVSRRARATPPRMTTSNGEGSGWLLPGTGVMANNMMGEDDLHPGGFHAGPRRAAGGVDDGAVARRGPRRARRAGRRERWVASGSAPRCCR